MSGIWKKGIQSWRLPDSAGKADDPLSPDTKEENKDGPPTFEIDFSPSAQVVIQTETNSPSEANPAVEAVSEIPFDADQSPIVMLDDPLPVSFSANVDLQEQFVAEVLKNAQEVTADSHPAEVQLTVVASVSAALADEPASLLVSLPLSSAGADGLTVVGSSAHSLDLDRTQITDQTLAARAQEASGTGDERTIPSYQLAQASQQAPQPAPQPAPQQVPPEPPRTAGATANTPESEKTKVKKSDAGAKGGDSKSGKEEKTKAGSGTKVGASAKDKDKTVAGGKKAPDGGTKTAESNVTDKSTNNVAPPAAGRTSGLGKDVKMLLVLMVFTMLAFAAVMFKRLNKQQHTQQMSTEIAQSGSPDTVAPVKRKLPKGPTDEPSAIPSKNKTSDRDKKNRGAETVGTSDPKLQGATKSASVNLKSASEKNGDKETNKNEDQIDGELDLTFLLTKPVSRYSESNRALSPLFEVSNALDRVQPRRVVSLLRALPASFGSSDPAQKTALQELTGRYYMQVGAYPKALLLFRQSCSDPAKTSEVEVCLHAARAYVLMGLYDPAQEVIQGLSMRMTGNNSQWREWLRLLEIAVQFRNPVSETMIKFIDEMSDKGPFLTREWNLQLSSLFARQFLFAKDNLRKEVLKSISGTRKKTLEVRLAPEKYGQDIGSYMLPAFLNLMLRHHEIPLLNVTGDEPSIDSELSLTSWIFNVISMARANEPRETRARLAPLFAERGFSALARLIEGQLAAQAGDYIGAHAMILEQIGPTLNQSSGSSPQSGQTEQVNEFISSTQRLRTMPFLYVEWLFLGVKVSAGLNDKDSLRTYILALENARRRFPELSQEFQYWIILGRAHRVLGQASKVESQILQAEKLAETLHEKGFIAAERVWLLMQKGERLKAKELMKQKIREIPHHARLLEVAAEFSSYWNEEPSLYLKLEADIPQRYQTRGRDSVLLSFFTIRKLLSSF